MAADAWKLYHTAKEGIGDLTIDLDNDTIKVALFTSASDAATLTSGNKVLAHLTNQVAANSGYVAGGSSAAATWTQSSATVTFDCANVAWTATTVGATTGITARFAVMYANATRNGATDPLIAMSLLDNTPADVSVTTGNTLTITMSTAGVFDLSGGS